MRFLRPQALLATVLWLVALSGLFVADAHAQPDPAVSSFGSSSVPWTTSNLWVDTNGNGIPNEVDEPSRGRVNRLVARVWNLGTTPANNIQVRFSYAPYGAWHFSDDSHFKVIDDTININDPTNPIPPGDSRVVNVDWDLTNLAENNGGIWGGLTLADFDHFCVRVQITASDDSNMGNNRTQQNFANVEVAFGTAAPMKIVIANPKDAQAIGELSFRGLPRDWNPVVKGLRDPFAKFALAPREFKVITLTLTPPPRRAVFGTDGPARHNNAVRTRSAALLSAPSAASQQLSSDQRSVDVGLKLDGELIGGVSFVITAVEPGATQAGEMFPPSGGTLSPYLIGTWDLRSKQRTFLQLVNPTGRHLRVLVALFDDNEKPLKCLRESLSPNDLVEIDIRRLLEKGFGVVKVVSYRESEERPEAGVVGYQRLYVSRFFYRGLATESALHQIPLETLKGDLPIIRQACQ